MPGMPPKKKYAPTTFTTRNVKATGIPINIRRKSDPIIKRNASHHSMNLKFFFYN
jgi:hypothetical protein